MNYIARKIDIPIQAALTRGKSVLLLGSRQTGKSTLCQYLKPDQEISLAHPRLRQQYETDPALLIDEIVQLAEKLQRKPLVLIDEVQKIPELLDAIQYLIDKQIAQFLLTGSSARKLRKRGVNWLPGRVILFHLDPLSLAELDNKIPSLETLLMFGSLPNIITTDNERDKEQELMAYVNTYLEDEIRTEAAVRNISHFSAFLLLAASDSGKIINLSHLAQEVHVAHSTISAYYQILEDCLIAEKINSLTKSKKRKRLSKTPKYLFFDLGVRRLCAKEGNGMPSREILGQLFEQFVGLELLKQLRLAQETFQLLFWRDNNGPEIDWIIERKGEYIPVEVKWTDKPSLQDAKHLQLFLEEYPEAKQAYIVCRTAVKRQLAERIYALPWQMMSEIIINTNSEF